MEQTNLEMAVIKEATEVATEDQIRGLSDLQLVFVGGGIAELVGI